MQIKFDAYRQPLIHLAKNPMVAGFLRWWLTELRMLLPAQWRSSSLDLTDTAGVRLAMPGVIVSRIEKGRLVSVGEVSPVPSGAAEQKSELRTLLDKARGKSGKTVVILPTSSVLLKKMRLPLAAEEGLENILAFEMDRHTPFKADEVFFDYRIVHRDMQKNRLDLEIAVVPREVVERPVAQLGGWGITPVAVMIAEQDVLNEYFNLLPRARRPQPAPLLGRYNRALLALVLMLAVGAMLLPIIIKREAVLHLTPIVERAKLAAEATDDLHRKLDALAGQYNFLLEKKQASPVLVVVFDELTRILPDDTWVQQLDLKGKELQFMGETGSSSKLIGLMEQSKILHDTNFRSPLTKGQNPSSEHFHLGAEIKPSEMNVISAGSQKAAAPGSESGPPASPGAGKAQQPQDEGKTRQNVEPPASHSSQENG
ncbi:MAG: pilus assembly protein PilM [Sulfuricella denitrificans]|nr:pilus assembly protein PilM [Sulfuricella denitrificans]